MKKVLAGACLGLVGMGVLSGCSMSDSQTAALDLVADKSDEIINLLEQNMEFNNNKLSKEDAAEKIAIARNFWLANKVNVLMNVDGKTFSGFYDKVDSEFNTNVYATKDENRFKYAEIKNWEGRTLGYYSKHDYVNDVYYSYSHVNDEDGAISEWDYHEAESISVLFNLDVLAGYEIPVITPDMIKEFQVLEDGYKFTIYNYSSGYDAYNEEVHVSRYKFDLTLKNNLITEIDFEQIFLQNQGNIDSLTYDEELKCFKESGEQVFNTVLQFMDRNYGSSDVVSEDRVSINLAKCTYQYDNIDFSDIDQKFAAIEAEHVNNA